ncbi:MAG: ABC transporter permease [Bacteroidales bacterium]|jgi:putative ABC transport system permease protein|nr:ABC transporter permease [Bacteroidales bacterium]MDD2264227.1 ABC transporter permease [Bacteroidales bacterium]MDD2831461.1 ABC transporter permease [Bacteroidales bacterium]MDD3208455.1 ABC transporter permease [Bacteroidales bacterium]MDD3697132.1 ABC transporter permease [Bacteroidales bacterium]
MIKQYFKQIVHLWKNNPLFSAISVLATALTIAFVMTLYMVYTFRTADMAPEINRSRTLYSDAGYSYLTKDHSNANRGMSKSTAEKIFGNLENAETVSYIMNKGEGVGFVGTSPANREKRIVSPIDDNYFHVFKFDFLSGNPITDEQFEAQSKVAVITDKLALSFFSNTEEAIGKNITIGFEDYRVAGVVRSVSSLFNKAYSDVWIVADKTSLDWGQQYSEGLRGMCQVIVAAKKGVPLKKLNAEIDEKIKKLNDGLREFTFELEMLSHPQTSFFNDKAVNPAQIIIVLILILLIVPAINMSGLLSTQIKKRSEEIGIRKAYGASNWQVGKQLLFENLMLTLVGGAVGLIFSFIAVSIFKNILLADIMTINASESFDLPTAFFFNPTLFFLMLLFCLVINLLSAMLPVWNASRTTIIQTIKGE